MLSEVTENLTYRLLELEERLGEGERELAQLRDSAPDSGELPEAVELWLQETEERLGRVEELLSQGGEPRQGGPRVVAAQRRRSDGHPPALEMLNGRSPTDQGDTPVPEEGEQAFLDEQIA